jgi:hypothetical protein
MNSVKLLRWALFWETMQHRVVLPYRHFGTSYWVPSFNSWPLKMGQISCPQMSVRNYRLYTVYDPRRAQKPEITVKLFFIVKARSKNCITISQITAQNTFTVEHSFIVQRQCEDFQFLIHGYFACWPYCKDEILLCCCKFLPKIFHVLWYVYHFHANLKHVTLLFGVMYQYICSH